MFLNRLIKLFVVLIAIVALTYAQSDNPNSEDAAVEEDSAVTEETSTTEDPSAVTEEASTTEDPSAVTEEASTTEDPSATEKLTKVDSEGSVKMSNVLINDFENADRWFGAMSVDNGLIQVEKRKGAVKEIRETKPNNSQYVLGAKVSFFKAGIFEASIEPPVPVIVPGYTKKLTVWAYGRGYKHKLSAIVKDFKGRIFKFTFGSLSFYGWKKMETTIPSDPAWPFFSQIDVTKQTFFQTHGVTFLGFLIEFDPKESWGRFYVYLDDLVAESNVHLYEKELEFASIPEDERLDPVDDW